ncbi:MAG: hypothetical protein HFI09_05210, partial [Bacilli bacterium]|nr:hypothetical protein [Bacilli bacterium]
MPKTKYFYQGMPLIEYCRLHNLDYPYIYARIRRMEKNKIVITEEIMHEIVSKAKRKMKVYMFKGMPLNTYCKKFNISYKRVYRKIKKLESLNIVISEEILEKIIKAVQNTTTFQIIYYWEGMPLIEYCKLHNIPYDDILWRIKHDDRDVSLSIKIGTAIELYLPKGIKYYVGDMPFIEFCKKENLSYDLGIRLLRRKYEMPYVIQYLRKRKDKILQKEIKEFLLTNLNHEDLLLDFAQENHFSITNVKNVIKEGIPLGNAIMLIFYLGTENEFHLKSISMKTVKEVVSLLKKNERLSLEELLLLDGMGFIEYRYFIKKEMTNLIRATLARHISTSEGIYRNAY